MAGTWRDVARALTTAATAMESDRALDIDGALRLAVWGTPDARYPGDHATGSDVFDQASTLVEAATGWQGHGIGPHVDRNKAITAARSEAARVRDYTGRI